MWLVKEKNRLKGTHFHLKTAIVLLDKTIITRKANGFKSLQLNRLNITQIKK